jgi:hypothetical protein
MMFIILATHSDDSLLISTSIELNHQDAVVLKKLKDRCISLLLESEDFRNVNFVNSEFEKNSLNGTTDVSQWRMEEPLGIIENFHICLISSFYSNQNDDLPTKSTKSKTAQMSAPSTNSN